MRLLIAIPNIVKSQGFGDDVSVLLSKESAIHSKEGSQCSFLTTLPINNLLRPTVGSAV